MLYTESTYSKKILYHMHVDGPPQKGMVDMDGTSKNIKIRMEKDKSCKLPRYSWDQHSLNIRNNQATVSSGRSHPTICL